MRLLPSRISATTFQRSPPSSSVATTRSVPLANGSIFSANAPLVNQGTLVVEGDSTFAGTFTAANGSVLRVLAGNASGSGAVNASLSVAQGLANQGTIELTSANLAGNAMLSVGSGTLTNANSGTVRTLPGTGGTRTITAAVDNAGLVQVGGAGASDCLTVDGPYTQQAAGSLAVEVGQPTACSGFDRLAVTGSATLNGTLNVATLPSYVATPGQTFDIMTFTSRTGVFTTEIAPGFTITYNPTNVRLTGT